MFKVNINDCVYFVPTKEAKRLYRNYYEKMASEYPQIKRSTFPTELEVDANGFARMQLWDFCEKFGEAFYCGKEVICEGGSLFFDGKPIRGKLKQSHL